jgi:hypothetical protein
MYISTAEPLPLLIVELVGCTSGYVIGGGGASGINPISVSGEGACLL